MTCASIGVNNRPIFVWQITTGNILVGDSHQEKVKYCPTGNAAKMPKPSGLVRWPFSVVFPHAFWWPKSREDLLPKCPFSRFGRNGHSLCDPRPGQVYRFLLCFLVHFSHSRDFPYNKWTENDTYRGTGQPFHYIGISHINGDRGIQGHPVALLGTWPYGDLILAGKSAIFAIFVTFGGPLYLHLGHFGPLLPVKGPENGQFCLK